MAQIYGSTRWEKEYGTAPNDAWESALASRTMDDIARGIEAAQADEGKFLPTAGTFATWCKPHNVGGADYLRDLPSLEKLAGGSEVGRRWLAYMVIDGIRPRPPGMTQWHLEEALEGADIAAMREQAKREAAHVRKLVEARK